MKKIVITIKEKNDETGDCSVNVKMEKSKTETTNEAMTASNVYQLILGEMKKMSEIK